MSRNRRGEEFREQQGDQVNQSGWLNVKMQEMPEKRERRMQVEGLTRTARGNSRRVFFVRSLFQRCVRVQSMSFAHSTGLANVSWKAPSSTVPRSRGIGKCLSLHSEEQDARAVERWTGGFVAGDV
jgi:hypothetical protein